MAVSVIRLPLSHSVNGKPIKMVGASTDIHAANSSTTSGAGGVWDEIWLWASYSSIFANANVQIYFGGTTNPDNYVIQPSMWKRTPQLIVPGFLLQNSLIVKGSGAGTFSGDVCISGYVNRITN